MGEANHLVILIASGMGVAALAYIARQLQRTMQMRRASEPIVARIVTHYGDYGDVPLGEEGWVTILPTPQLASA